MAGVLPVPPLNQYIAATMSSSSSSSSVSSSSSTISAVGAPTSTTPQFKSNFLSSSSSSSNKKNNSNQQQLTTTTNNNNFKVIPSLRLKTNELFYRYLSDKERQDQIKEIITYIKQNNSIPKINELASFINTKDLGSIKSTSKTAGFYGSSSDVLSSPLQTNPHYHHQFKQPPPSLHQQNGISSSSSVTTSSNAYQITSMASNLRSKSPPSLHSPPMSPVSRTPQSPKSPRQRQSILNTNNNNNSNNNNNTIINSALKVANSFNKDQRPQSPRDLNDKLKTVTPSNITNTTTSNQLPVTITNNNNLKLAVNKQPNNKNDKEIQIQRVSTTTTPIPSISNEQPSITNNNNNNNKIKLSQSTPINNNNIQTTNQSDFSKSSNFIEPSSSVVKPTPANVSNTVESVNNKTISVNNSNIHTIAASLAASTTPSLSESNTPIAAKAKIQQQNAQMNTKILATLNSKLLHQQQNQTQQLQQQKQLVPQFHYPNGKPDEKQFKDDPDTMKLVSAEFRLQKEAKVYKETFADIMKIIGLPKYWKILLFRALTLNTKLNYVTYTTFEQVWTKLNQTCHDRPSLFIKLMSTTTNNNTIVYDDWEPLMQDIVDTHPGLKFLHDHKEFHTRYIKTVIARIYYTVNRSWSGKITLTELKRSNFLSVLESLELEDDINLIKDYFSYEHFYVIYCKFWELDKDHDLLISKEDLYRHNNYAISPRVIDRIFSGTVIRGRDWRDNLMSYYDFVWFLISEEDKRNTTSIEYWFRVLDLDGDGVLSMYELEYFYNEQIEQMRERQIEYMPFTDLLCQILDLVKPTESGKIHLKDLKNCKMTNVFFDTFINLEKYLEYEQRDPFSNIRDLDGPELSDWEKYAADEYENLVSEDVNADNQDFNYEDDFEEENNMYNNNNNNPNSFNNVGTNGTSSNNSTTGQQQQQQQPQSNWIGNSLAGDSQTASSTNNRNRLLLNNNSPISSNTSSFITNRNSFDEL